ncbi:MAG: VCBS repeat-containing protein [Chitinophagaceae bacterium]|nr:MAG: VCBS repeat-containing protein [Chitinophagaceae bacterium]
MQGMKVYFFSACLLIGFSHETIAQNASPASRPKNFNDATARSLPDFSRTLFLEEKPDTTANVSFGDFDGDGHTDILLVKGRHWPIIDRILIGDGTGKIRKVYNLGETADKSYTGGIADFNGDGFPDIAVSNDYPNRKLVYFNDGKGNFKVGSEFGIAQWPTRNLSIADLNRDGFPDIIMANRGRPGKTSNYICLNDKKGQFSDTCIRFAPYPATTIMPADINGDGFTDLIVPHRDGGQGYIYPGNGDHDYPESRRSEFGPADASVRTAASADFDGDGSQDIVTIDEFKGVHIYFGEKNYRFSKGISMGNPTPVPYALALADLDGDGRMDIIIGHVNAPSTILFSNGSDRSFITRSFGDSNGTVYGFAVGDFNEDGIPDIAAGRSEAQSVLYFGGGQSKMK